MRKFIGGVSLRPSLFAGGEHEEKMTATATSPYTKKTSRNVSRCITILAELKVQVLEMAARLGKSPNELVGHHHARGRKACIDQWITLRATSLEEHRRTISKVSGGNPPNRS